MKNEKSKAVILLVLAFVAGCFVFLTGCSTSAKVEHKLEVKSTPVENYQMHDLSWPVVGVDLNKVA